ncbi:DNA transposase [Frankliniella fusca]|uniref:DNA transposase n=1 Tax=Frankliniella fusca TaxID=407009 RepID=A0AAE1H3P9_9NEOP|nr:DNA transposase [Frankliniella fusca]
MKSECCVMRTCPNRRFVYCSQSDVKSYGLPKEGPRREAWEYYINKYNRTNVEHRKHSAVRVCSEHFPADHFTSVGNLRTSIAHPTIPPPKFTAELAHLYGLIPNKESLLLDIVNNFDLTHDDYMAAYEEDPLGPSSSEMLADVLPEHEDFCPRSVGFTPAEIMRMPVVIDLPTHPSSSNDDGDNVSNGSTEAMSVESCGDENVDPSVKSQQSQLLCQQGSTKQASFDSTTATIDGDSPLKIPCKRRYGELTEDDMTSPRRGKVAWGIVTERHTLLNRKVKTLQEKVRIAAKKVKSLQGMLNHLENERQIDKDVAGIIKNAFPGPAAAVFDRMLNAGVTDQFNPELMKFALTLNFHSPAAYSYVRDTFFNCLPHPRTIRKLYQVINGDPGFSKEALDAVKVAVEEAKKEGKQLLCSLMCDEMYIRKQSQWAGHRVVGYPTAGSTPFRDNAPLAKEAWVMMLVAINGSWKMPIGYFLINSLNGVQRSNLLKECLNSLSDSGAIIPSVTFDGTSVNVTMAESFTMESQDTSKVSSDIRPSSDEPGGHAYEEKLTKLQKYLPFLNDTIARLESSKDKVRASQLGKMKNLQQLLTSQKQKMKIETLDRCEEVLKKLQEKLKSPLASDKVEPRNIVKTEPEDVMESPASPPQVDLNPTKSAPKIIPVERCATLEKDYSHAEEGSSLEASRGRLKGLMQKTDSQASSSTPSPQIPGLDMVFPSQDSVAFGHSLLNKNLRSPTESESLSKSCSLPMPHREEWPRLESSMENKTGAKDWPAARDVDERRLNRDLDLRHSRIDIDHRHMSSNDRHGMQVHSVMSHPPFFPPMNHLTPKSALLPRHVPSHNTSYNSTSSVQEITRGADKIVLETKSSHQTITFASPSSVGGRSPLLPTPDLERIGNQSRHLPNQRDVYDTPSNSTFLPSKSFSSSTSNMMERKSISSVSSNSLHTSTAGESMKTSARERIMQGLDQVEKLGVSSGGALRKLKGDMEKGKTRPGETELTTNEDQCQRPLDVQLRKIDPRLEKDRRRSSLEDEMQKYRNTPRAHESVMGLNSSSLPLNMPNFSGHPISYGSSQQASVQWSQSHAGAQHGRTVYQGQQSVLNTYWQGTCSVKQVSSVTTAHDLGMRYQPKTRHGKPMNAQYDRNVSISKPGEERTLGHREPEVLRRENEIHHGKRPSDPRLAALKPSEEKRNCDNKSPDSNSKRKDKSRGKDDGDYSSPLGSIYNEEKRNKTGQGYGLQSYKIPKRPKDPSPPKDIVQASNVIESRLSTRDPRLSRVGPLQCSPETVKETSVLPDHQRNNVGQGNTSTSLQDKKKSSNKNEETANSSSKNLTRSPSPTSHSSGGNRSPPSSNTVELNASSNSSLKADTTVDQGICSPSTSRARSPSAYRTSRARSRSKSRGRSSSRSRGRSRSREKSSVRGSPKRRGSPSRSRAGSRSSSRKAEEVRLGRSRADAVHQELEQNQEGEAHQDLEQSQGEEALQDLEPDQGKEALQDPEPDQEEEVHQEVELSHEDEAHQEAEPVLEEGAHLGPELNQGEGADQEVEPNHEGGVCRKIEASLEEEAHQELEENQEGEVPQEPEQSQGDAVGIEAHQLHDIELDPEKEVLPGSSRNSPKSRSRRSRSRSVSRTKTSSFRAKSSSRDPLKSRGRSQSSDSDKNSLVGSWKRKESPSPDRTRARRKSSHGARRRSLSSDSNRSRDSSSISSRAVSRTRSRGLSRNRSHARSRSPDQSRQKCESHRSLSRESVKDNKKSVASSRSSSCSGRSSPLFPKGRSRSQSPHRELNFDKLLKTDVNTLDVKKDSVVKISAQEKDTVVSSSLNDRRTSADVVIDVPTSTSENIPEVNVKADAGSSSEAYEGSKNSKPSSSSVDSAVTAVEPGNILVGLIKTLASQDLFKQTSLIELAALAASQLPEEKRNKVLEIFREGTGETAKEDLSKPEDSKEDSENLKSKIHDKDESKVDLNMQTVTSDSRTSFNTKKGKKKKQSTKTKTAKVSSADALPKANISPEGSEKQKKKRGKNELEKLHEDIREMFISKEVVTATGQRSCRMRKENKDIFQPPKSRPGSADEKVKLSQSKFCDEVMDFSDDSPSKDQTSLLNTTGSTSDGHALVDIDKNIRSSSESEDDMHTSKFKRTSPDSSGLVLKRRSKINLIESDTESDSAINDSGSPQSSREPKVVTEKSLHAQRGRRNVARRGRKISSISRDQIKMREEMCTPSYDGDCDEEEEESKIEDKDMSQIDTSNIIQIEGAGNKLTRNQLKLLKGPEPKEDSKLTTKRALNSSREFSECDSDTSKSGTVPYSPVKKKRKIKKSLNSHIGFLEKSADLKIMSEATDPLMSDEIFERSSTLESVHENNSEVIHILDSSAVNTSEVEEHEAPLISRIQNPPSLNIEAACTDDLSSGKPEYHEDLDYTITSALDKATCKICRFSGRMIVAHYLLSHPSEEVLISRLSKDLAEQAKANISNYNESDSKKVSGKKRLSTAPLMCLICKHVAKNFMRLYEHVSIHTGEYRYSCNRCNFKAAQRISIKSHAKSRHPNTQVQDLCSVSQIGEGSTAKVLLAYLCSECNYFQLLKSNLTKHLLRYHHQNTAAQAIQVCISQVVASKKLAVSKAKGVNEDLTHLEASAELSSVSEQTAHENISDCQPGVSLAEFTKDPSSDLPDSDFVSQAVLQPPHEERSTNMSNETEILENQPSTLSKKPPIPVEMSIFIGSEQNTDDDRKLQEDRKKLLEDAGLKIRERPKIRSSISEKLAQRLHFDQSTSPQSRKATEEDSLQSSLALSLVDSIPLQARTNLRTTPARLAQKSSDSSEKRLAKTTTRTPSSLDTETLGSNEVPDEVKAPLPASTLQSTLQRMQTTIESPVSTPPAIPQSSPSSISTHSQFKLKKGSVIVGPVEAVAVGDAQGFFFSCSAQNCGFRTPQASTFLKHIERHSEKPVSAPCSVCDEGGNILRDLRSSFNHLVKYHLVEESSKEISGTSSASPSASLTSNKSVLIRPRRMPGDTLSISDKLTHDLGGSGSPSLVIASVISLSKDHTPDGTPLEIENSLVLSPGNLEGGRKFLTHLKKDPSSMSEMMKFEKICHFFKCMGQYCAFSSNRKEIFTDHYQKHLLKELRHNSHAASEVYEWQKCAYCGDVKDSGEDLVDHICMLHGSLKYQCSGCFYRAATAACVIFHQTKSHCSNVMVFECSFPESDSERQQMKSPLKLLQSAEIQAYKCGQFSGHGECGRLYVSSEDFSSHQQLQHPSDNIFYCKECGLGLDSSSKLICHYSTSHSYRRFHCLHCPKASETSEEISCHMCLDHPDQKMIVASRASNEQISSSSKTFELANGCMIEILDLDEMYSNIPTSLIPSKNQETDNGNDPVLFDESYSATCHTYEIGSKLSWAFKSGCQTSSSLPKALPSTDVQAGTKWDSNEDIVNIEQISCGNYVDAEGKEKQLSLKYDECDKHVLVESNEGDTATNLSGSSLYICGYLGCLFRGNTSNVLKAHMLSCGFAQDTGNLSCVHCQKVFRNPSTLLEHIPKHGVPRYTCGLCDDFRTTHPTIAHRHLRNSHKIVAVEMVPLDPDNPDGVLVLRPKDNVRKRVKAKIQQPGCNKTSFGPEEKNELPLSAVFTSDVTCKVCNYATKVRSNMLRHLEQHELGCEPSPVPVLNPVPCLERNEKMFDTMTNHAISSTVPVRRDSNAFKVLDEPKFVPENQRFVCCAPACHQISSDDAMLRHHIRVLHPEILVYKCPHCPEYENDTGKLPIMVEKLGSHLKMHDSRLYSCLSCSYYHYQRHIVERHTGEKHPEQKLIRIVREPQPDGPLDTENLVDAESEIIGTEGTYECSLCSHKGSKTEVMSHVASQHRIHAQYKCTQCNFRANARVRFNAHFAKRHPNEKEAFIELYRKSKGEKLNEEAPQPILEISTPPVEPIAFDSTPLWSRNSPRVRHLRGILFEENSLKPRELEQTETKRADGSLSGRNKRPSNAILSDDTIVTKRGRKDESSFTCAKCPCKFPTEQENNYREHLRSHFSCDNVRYQCGRCLKGFPSSEEGRTHVTVTHQKLFTASDIVDTHSDDYINMDVTRQMLEFGLPAEATLNRVSSSYSPSKSSSTLQTIASRRLSPRGSVGSITPPASGTPSVSPKKFDSVKGIKALGSRSVLKPMPCTTLQLDQSTQPVIEPGPKTNLQADSWVNVDDGDIEVDESALEEDIEEIEDEETSSEENQLQKAAYISEVNAAPKLSSPIEGVECKYKDSCKCLFISRNQQEAYHHEMMHWEIKPWKCAIRESSVRLHSTKVHPGSLFKPIKNDLPPSPTIVPLLSQRKKKLPVNKDESIGQMKTSSLDEKLSDCKMAEIADIEEISKSVNVLRCCFCRLRETSLSRLFYHWKSSHKSNKSLLEKTADGQSIVPFKFREVKPGAKGIETIAFKCGLCARTGTIKLLLDHYPSRHPGEKLQISELIHDRLQCALCPRQFSAKASLSNHFLSEHPGEQVASMKVKTKAMADDLEIKMACLYCYEPVKSALEIKEHHLNFHSHLDARYIELENNEPPQQLATKRSVARKSTSRFRAVARKSTGGRNWHSTRTSPQNVPDSSSDSSTDSDDDNTTSSEDLLDENQISCSMMIEGISMRVSLATLSKFSNIYPTIALKKLDP